MATASIDACPKCENPFNSDFFQSVSLPCGHAFCLLCLVRMRESDDAKCPTCHTSLSGFEAQAKALPGLDALTGVLQMCGEVTNSRKRKRSMDRCKKHSMTYDFWVSTEEEFYCRGCAAENPPVELELIEDSIPEIKVALASGVPSAKKEVERHLQSLDDMLAEFVRQGNCANQFRKAVETFNDNLKQNIEQILTFKSKVQETAADLINIETKIDSIKSTAKLHVVREECDFIMKKVAVRYSLPIPNLSQILMSSMTRTFTEEADTVNAPFNASFVDAVLNGSPEPILEVLRASKNLSHGQNWTVDYNNCDAVRLALADKRRKSSMPLQGTPILAENKQPRVLTLIQRDDGREALPVASLSKAVRSGAVNAKFLDTFYSAKDTTTDTRRLKHLLANKSARLSTFYGHLDHSAISELPHSVTELGLAIGSAADAEAVSGLSPWKRLRSIHVSVSSSVAVKDLKPMPNVPHKGLFFPFLTDAKVDVVKPAIEALVPELRMKDLSFPECLLTATGVRRLAQQLRGVKIEDNFTIEATGTWKPDAHEQTTIRNELLSDCASNLRWDMNWFHC